ncbi:MAG TPA: rRNA maturation RNase YbeY [bacterium]|nr:rRNA maturation RNase YbeY [bacterium]
MKSLQIDCQDEQGLLDFELTRLVDLEKLILNSFPEKFSNPDNFQVVLSIVSDQEIQKLNRDYRGKDQVTDVLSFAYDESEIDFPAGQVAKPLGDIIISIDQVKRQALDFKQSPEKEFYLLLIHGILHLLGYDHLTSAEASEMESLEDQLLRELFKN